MTHHGGMVAVVAAKRCLRRISRVIERRILQRAGEALVIRRIVAHVVAEARVEATLTLAQVAKGPYVGGRKNRRRERGRVTEDRMQVVLRRQELAHGDLAPAALQAGEGFTAGDARAR